MEFGDKATGLPLPGEVRFTIPKVLLNIFAKDPRILIKWRPDGIFPIDPGLLQETNWLKEVINDKDFTANYEIVIMQKG